MKGSDDEWNSFRSELQTELSYFQDKQKELITIITKIESNVKGFKRYEDLPEDENSLSSAEMILYYHRKSWYIFSQLSCS